MAANVKTPNVVKKDVKSTEKEHECTNGGFWGGTVKFRFDKDQKTLFLSKKT